MLGWQAAQSPSTRKFTLQQIGAGISLPLAGGTLTGKLTITLGGIEVTGATTFHSPVSLQAITATTGVFSGALVAPTGTFSGAITSGGAGVVLNSGGTYGINITGNAATATNATNAAAATNATNAVNQNGGTVDATTGAFGTFLGIGAIATGDPISTNVAGWVFNSAGGAEGYSKSATPPLALGVSSASFPLQAFYLASAIMGSITTNGSGTLYNTSSDETLKDIYDPISAADAGAMIDGLRPVWFSWKHDLEHRPEPGFGAQTTHRIFPWAVTPGTDEMPWSMDPAKLVVLAIAEIKALRARVAELEAR